MTKYYYGAHLTPAAGANALGSCSAAGRGKRLERGVRRGHGSTSARA